MRQDGPAAGSSDPDRAPARAARVLDAALPAAGALLFAVVAFPYATRLLDHLRISTRDHAFFTQSLWNFNQGHGLRTTVGHYGDHLFSEHLYLTHVVWSPLYAAWTDPKALMLVQAAALGLAGLALYRVARARGLSPWLAGLSMALLLCHPTLHNAASGSRHFGYHPDAWLPALFLLAWDAQLRRRPLRFWLLVAGLLATLEQSAVLLASLGLYGWATSRGARGPLLVGVSTAWFAVATGVAVPWLSGAPPYYLRALAPLDTAGLADALRATARFAGVLLVMGLGLPLLSRLSLVALPSILVVARAHWSGYPVPAQPLSWHALPVVAVFAVAGVEAIRGIRARGPGIEKLLGCALAVGCCALALYTARMIYRPIPELPPERRAALAQVLRAIPDEAAVSAGYFLGPHLSHRRDLHVFPRLADAEYVLVDEAPRRDFRRGLERLPQLRSHPAFRVVEEASGFVLLRREPPPG